jgi:hypothetical protein
MKSFQRRRAWRILAACVLACPVFMSLPQPAMALTVATDPPAFGPITLQAEQSLRLNVFCWEHPTGVLPPGPCRGEVMFHDASGREIGGPDTYELRRGESASFVLPGALAGAGLLTPCIMPAPGSGKAIPTAELLDRSGRMVAQINPAAPRVSDFQLPPALSLLNLLPVDPPAFGPVSILDPGSIVDPGLRINLVCWAHPVGLVAPKSCSGAVMFHDAAGRMIGGPDTYELRPGESASVALPPGALADAGLFVPCVIPDPGSGRAIPGVEIFDAADGSTQFFINPAAARLSKFQGQ